MVTEPLPIGTRVGYLQITSVPYRINEGTKYVCFVYDCECVCGKSVTLTRGTLMYAGPNRSCGCQANNVRTKHGCTKTRLYRIWALMKSRCCCPTDTAHKYYHDKGITVCQDWQDFVGFKQWAEQAGYQEHLTIDRISPDKNYEPSNCRWVTQTEQAKNIVHKPKRVKCIETGYQYASAKEAAYAFGSWLDRPRINSIRAACTTGRGVYGYHFKYI